MNGNGAGPSGTQHNGDDDNGGGSDDDDLSREEDADQFMEGSDDDE